MEEDEGPAPVRTPAPRYLVLTITAPAQAAEAVAALLHEARTGGVVEEAAPPGLSRLRAFLREDVADGVLEPLRAQLSGLPVFGLGAVAPDLSVELLADGAWATVWKEHFHAFPVGRRLWIVPTWEAPPAERVAIPIVLDPGMAFGSGLHPTTQLSLRLLEEHLRPGARVADIGTGSGILAIAAAKLGAAGVIAVDNDPVAAETARANVRHNAVAAQVDVIVGELLAPVRPPVDLIVANLTADPLEEMAQTISAHLRPGGILIASGIVDTRLAGVRTALEAHGLIVSAEAAAAEWRALVARASAGRGGGGRH